MISEIGNIKYKRITRISPSQFYSIKNCAYKSILAEAFEKKPLLPVSANAYFGIVLHKIIELIHKNEITEEETFNKRFDGEIALLEESLKAQGHGFLIPLQINVKDFGIKKILLKKHLRNPIKLPVMATDSKYISEKWFESKDKLIAGRIDLYIETGQCIEIIDFKTGAIKKDYLDDSGDLFSDIKSEYVDQLRLYAYLFYESTGKFPTHLSLVDLAKQKYSIEFNQTECRIIFDEAKKVLNDINKSIDETRFNANPSSSNCKFCLYRPACSFYLEFIKTGNLLNDIIGEIEDSKKYMNGNVSVNITVGKDKYTVTGFTTDMFDFFAVNRQKCISLFNLRKEAATFVYSSTKTTMVYD